MDLIEKVLKKHKNPVVAFSGGKDSTVVLDLVRKVDSDVPGIFCNTGIEYKSTLEYIKRVDNVIELKPDRTFFDCVKKYGWPGIKGKNPSSRINHCCYYLKDKPMLKFAKEDNVDLILTGIRKDESHQRFMRYTHDGSYSYVKSWKCCKAHPVLDQSTEDIFFYIHDNGLDFNLGYCHGMTRAGCSLCTAYCSWKEEMLRQSGLDMVIKVNHWRMQNVLDDYGDIN